MGRRTADPPDMNPYLQTALDAAHLAGVKLRRKLRQTRQVSYKGRRDIVTDADFDAQRTVLGLLNERYPEHAVLSEEGRHDIDLAGPRPTWFRKPSAIPRRAGGGSRLE